MRPIPHDAPGSLWRLGDAETVDVGNNPSFNIQL